MPRRGYNWHNDILGYLSMAIICPKKQLTFQEHSLKKTLTFEEQILSQDKYVNIFVHQMEPIVFIIHKYLSKHVQF